MRTFVLALSLLVAGLGLSTDSCAQAPSDSTYTVQSGDTLYSIAQRFGVSVEALQRWNGLENTALRVGQTLRVRRPEAVGTPEPSVEDADEPAPDTSAAATDTTAADTLAMDPGRVDTTGGDTTAASTATSTGPPPLYGHHTVATGDSFVTLALRLGTTADSLYALNDSVATPLSTGQTLRLPRRFAPPGHTVKPEETLYSIAGQYGVSVRALRTANAIDTASIQPGQRLRLPGRTAPETPPPGKWAVPDSTGAVAVYPDAFGGRLTASGLPYDPEDFVVSHPSLPYGTVLLLSRPDADRHTFARVIDRGPLDEGVLLDVSAAVATQLGIDPDTTPDVAVRVVWRDDE